MRMNFVTLVEHEALFPNCTSFGSISIEIYCGKMFIRFYWRNSTRTEVMYFWYWWFLFGICTSLNKSFFCVACNENVNLFSYLNFGSVFDQQISDPNNLEKSSVCAQGKIPETTTICKDLVQINIKPLIVNNSALTHLTLRSCCHHFFSNFISKFLFCLHSKPIPQFKTILINCPLRIVVVVRRTICFHDPFGKRSHQQWTRQSKEMACTIIMSNLEST